MFSQKAQGSTAVLGVQRKSLAMQSIYLLGTVDMVVDVEQFDGII